MGDGTRGNKARLECQQPLSTQRHLGSWCQGLHTLFGLFPGHPSHQQVGGVEVGRSLPADSAELSHCGVSYCVTPHPAERGHGVPSMPPLSLSSPVCCARRCRSFFKGDCSLSGGEPTTEGNLNSTHNRRAGSVCQGEIDFFPRPQPLGRGRN